MPIRQYKIGDLVRAISRDPTGVASEPHGPVLRVVGWDDRTGGGRPWFVYHLRPVGTGGGTLTRSDHLLVPETEGE